MRKNKKIGLTTRNWSDSWISLDELQIKEGRGSWLSLPELSRKIGVFPSYLGRSKETLLAGQLLPRHSTTLRSDGSNGFAIEGKRQIRNFLCDLS